MAEESSVALEAFEARILERAKQLEELRGKMVQLDGFIAKHGTIGTDEENARIQDQYKEYEGLVSECEGVKEQIEKIVAECRLATGCDWTASFTDDFAFELKKA